MRAYDFAEEGTNSDHPGLGLLLGNNWIHDNHTVRENPNLWLDM